MALAHAHWPWEKGWARGLRVEDLGVLPDEPAVGGDVHGPVELADRGQKVLGLLSGQHIRCSKRTKQGATFCMRGSSGAGMGAVESPFQMERMRAALVGTAL